MVSLPLVEYKDSESFNLSSTALDYLLVSDANPWRARRLARYPLTIKQRARRLTAYTYQRMARAFLTARPTSQFYCPAPITVRMPGWTICRG